MNERMSKWVDEGRTGFQIGDFIGPRPLEAVSQLCSFLLEKVISNTVSAIMACVGVIERDF